MEIWILVALILSCGVLAMAEMAVGASRISHLAMRAEQGSTAAAAVLGFRQHASRLLATTQLGITALAMLSGVYGEALWVPRLQASIGEILPVADSLAYAIALGLVVTVITFFSIVFGEVIPKRLALAHPEALAESLAGLITLLLKLAHPLVIVVSKTADWVLQLFPFKGSAEATASDEIRFLIEAGRKEGNLDQTESEILGNVFRLDNRCVAGIMTPAAAIACLDLSLPREENLKVLQQRPVSRFLLCKGGISNALGFVKSRELLQELLNGNNLDFGKLSPLPPHYVPGTLSLIGLLEFFKEKQTRSALVANEFGVTEGLVTLSDLMGTVVGDVLSGAVETPLALQRTDGSWLLDGLLAIDEMKVLLGIKELPEEDLGNYHTVGGFIIVHLGRIPKKTESFDWAGWHFEIMDMEKNRVDEVLATRSVA
ncbi:hemolysin family protein [Dechloromonas denitrificans]|uniref:hemolysin family protein n=1 Tax=Dechloromonas denitrificans TaxID=281362 RepID=UPI001CFB156B|nr:hemolysin family protein [Dechloromonas denitrificans]UCV07103.1 HlyC/CorC family transporter [Dechloromonas denitrificans]